MLDTFTDREFLFICIYLVGSICFLAFWCIPKIIAWLFYDTEIMANCCGLDIHTYGRSGIKITTYIEYTYNEKGYATSLFMLFSSYGKKQPIKIRSDKPWKAVSVYEFGLGIIGVIVIVPLILSILFI